MGGVKSIWDGLLMGGFPFYVLYEPFLGGEASV
jgi:hypothetical protein